MVRPVLKLLALEGARVVTSHTSRWGGLGMSSLSGSKGLRNGVAAWVTTPQGSLSSGRGAVRFGGALLPQIRSFRVAWRFLQVGVGV